MVDWNVIKTSVSVKSRNKSDIVSVIRTAAITIMADGAEYSVGSIRAWVEAGLNADAQEKNPAAELISVNWSTTKYALEKIPGMKMVKKNVFKYEAPKKSSVPKK